MGSAAQDTVSVQQLMLEWFAQVKWKFRYLSRAFHTSQHHIQVHRAFYEVDSVRLSTFKSCAQEDMHCQEWRLLPSHCAYLPLTVHRYWQNTHAACACGRAGASIIFHP